jgi:hypothetical protein
MWFSEFKGFIVLQFLAYLYGWQYTVLRNKSLQLNVLLNSSFSIFTCIYILVLLHEKEMLETTRSAELQTSYSIHNLRPIIKEIDKTLFESKSIFQLSVGLKQRDCNVLSDVWVRYARRY